MRQLDSRYPLNLLENITRKFIRQGDLMKQCRLIMTIYLSIFKIIQ